MEDRARVVIDGAYWVGNDIYVNVDGESYLVDTGAEVSMTRRSLSIIGHLRVQLANGEITTMPYGKWKGIVWLLGPNDLLTIEDLKELNKPKDKDLLSSLSRMGSLRVCAGMADLLPQQPLLPGIMEGNPVRPAAPKDRCLPGLGPRTPPLLPIY